jgi:nitrogen regulatory protein PII
MKQIAAIIKPSQLGDVQEALTKAGFEGMRIMESKGSVGKRVIPNSIVARNIPSTFCPR